MNEYHKVIKEVCDDLNIEFELLSDDYIIKLSKNGITKYVYGFKFDNNSHSVGLIIDDKYGLYKILKDYGIKAVEHEIVYDRLFTTKYDNNVKFVEDYFVSHNNKIVIKPNHGSGGSGVYLIDDIKQIENTMKILFEKNLSICVCPYYDAVTEYRVVVLNNKVELVYQKFKPIVYGNGKSTIRELLQEFNPKYFTNRKLVDESDASNYSKLANELANNNQIDFDKVLEEGKSFEYTWKFNSSKGAVVKVLKDELIVKELEKLSIDISKKVGLNFGNIDFIKTKNDDLYVIELNSGVDIVNVPEIKEYAKSIYTKAIQSLFE